MRRTNISWSFWQLQRIVRQKAPTAEIWHKSASATGRSKHGEQAEKEQNGTM